MNHAPKTIFCDIDGILLHDHGDIHSNMNEYPIVLENVSRMIREWNSKNYTIILTTARKESTRQHTEEQLAKAGIFYNKLIMDLPNGDHVLINSKKPNEVRNTAYSLNIVQNDGLSNVNLSSEYVTAPGSYFKKVEHPWGMEETLDCNTKYIVKRIFVKKTKGLGTISHKLTYKTIVILYGCLRIGICDSMHIMRFKDYHVGETVTINPYTIHSIKGIEDSLFLETSTNELFDVNRFSDSYGIY